MPQRAAEIPAARAATRGDLRPPLPPPNPSGWLLTAALTRRGDGAGPAAEGGDARGVQKRTHSWGVEGFGGAGAAAGFAPGVREAAAAGGKRGERPSGTWDTSVGVGTTTAGSWRGRATPLARGTPRRRGMKTSPPPLSGCQNGGDEGNGGGAAFLTHLVWKMWLHGKRLAPVTISSRQMMQTLSMA